MPKIELIQGDCLEKMKDIPDGSVVAVVTDPPYFLINNLTGGGFMSKIWDGADNLWKYLWQDNTFVNTAEKCFIEIQAGLNGEEQSIAPRNANISQSESHLIKESAQSAKKNLKSCDVLKKGFVHLLAVTKQEVLDWLSVLSLKHTKMLELLQNGEKSDVLFVIPILLPETENTRFAQENVTKLFKASGCKERIIISTGTEILKIKNAIVEIIGISFAEKFIKEITGNVLSVENIVPEKKYNVTILSPTNKEGLMMKLTLLLFATYVMPKWSKIENSLIENFFRCVWSECLRVLKPGGHLIAFGGSRTEHRLTCAIEDAGFEIRDKLCWIFAQGFPKSLNVSKQIQKMYSHKPDEICSCVQQEKNKVINFQSDYQESLRSNDGQLLGESNNDLNASPLQDDAPEYSHVGQQKDAQEKELSDNDHFLKDTLRPSNEDFSHHEEHQSKDSQVFDSVLSDKPLNKSNALLMAEHKKVDDKLHTQHLDDDLVSSSYKNKVNNIHTVYQNLPQCQVCGKYKIPQGLGTALKPAVEFITLARKPLSEPTIVKNFLKHGTGAIQIDGCRIPTTQTDASQIRTMNRSQKTENNGWGMNQNGSDKPQVVSEQGRFPANIICTDDALNDGEMTKSGARKRTHDNKNTIFGFGGGESEENSGSKSRYFCIDTWAEKHGLKEESKGRFPANIICTDDALNDGEMTKSGKHSEKEKNRVAQGMFAGGIATDDNWFGDSGSKSRYFDIECWWKKLIETSSIHPDEGLWDVVCDTALLTSNAYTFSEKFGGDKKVLDACCSTRSFWFDKNDERVLFQDIRNETYQIKPDKSHPERTLIVKPDVIGDFTKMIFEDNSFQVVVFDPPFIKFGENSVMAKTYGTLKNVDWQDTIRKGFSECFRVLRPNGVLIFKWDEYEIPIKEILKLTDQKPLFGHISGKRSQTHWVCFMKEQKDTFNEEVWAEKHGLLQFPKASKSERNTGMNGYILKSGISDEIVKEIKNLLSI